MPSNSRVIAAIDRFIFPNLGSWLLRSRYRSLADNPAAAIDVHEEIERAAGLLKDNPRLGHPGRAADTRALVVPAYQNDIIVYEIEGQRIHILAIMHGRQQWPDSFGGG